MGSSPTAAVGRTNEKRIAAAEKAFASFIE
jgi:hypothetical protein